MNLDRRGFLKMVGALTGSIFVPEFKLIVPEAPIPESLSWFSSVREWAAIDIRTDAILLRHDVLSKIHNVQLLVTHSIHNRFDREEIKQARLKSEMELYKAMKERGIKISDLSKLPPPPEYQILHDLHQ